MTPTKISPILRAKIAQAIKRMQAEPAHSNDDIPHDPEHDEYLDMMRQITAEQKTVKETLHKSEYYDY